MLDKGTLLASKGRFLPRSGLSVETIQPIDTTATVYNFSVKEFHTYFVGESGVLVHNASGYGLYELMENYNELLSKRSSLAHNKKDLSPEDLEELQKIASKVPKHKPVILESTIAEFPDIPIDKEFIQEVKVKYKEPQPEGDPRYFEMGFVIENKQIKGIKKGYYDFVITMEGEFKIGGGHYYLSKHSQYVKGAGQMEINAQGKISLIDPYSGHYKPSYEENKIIRELFRELGLFIN